MNGRFISDYHRHQSQAHARSYVRGSPRQAKFRHLSIASPLKSSDNSIMSIDTRKPLTQEEADHQAMIDHAFKGMPVDPEVRKRVHERAERVREKLRVK